MSKSKAFDYSKWDNLDSDEDSDSNQTPSTTSINEQSNRAYQILLRQLMIKKENADQAFLSGETTKNYAKYQSAINIYTEIIKEIQQTLNKHSIPNDNIDIQVNTILYSCYLNQACGYLRQEQWGQVISLCQLALTILKKLSFTLKQPVNDKIIRGKYFLLIARLKLQPTIAQQTEITQEIHELTLLIQELPKNAKDRIDCEQLIREYENYWQSLIPICQPVSSTKSSTAKSSPQTSSSPLIPLQTQEKPQEISKETSLNPSDKHHHQHNTQPSVQHQQIEQLCTLLDSFESFEKQGQLTEALHILEQCQQLYSTPTIFYSLQLLICQIYLKQKLFIKAKELLTTIIDPIFTFQQTTANNSNNKNKNYVDKMTLLYCKSILLLTQCYLDSQETNPTPASNSKNSNSSQETNTSSTSLFFDPKEILMLHHALYQGLTLLEEEVLSVCEDSETPILHSSVILIGPKHLQNQILNPQGTLFELILAMTSIYDCLTSDAYQPINKMMISMNKTSSQVFLHEYIHLLYRSLTTFHRLLELIQQTSQGVYALQPIAPICHRILLNMSPSSTQSTLQIPSKSTSNPANSSPTNVQLQAMDQIILSLRKYHARYWNKFLFVLSSMKQSESLDLFALISSFAPSSSISDKNKTQVYSQQKPIVFSFFQNSLTKLLITQSCQTQDYYSYMIAWYELLATEYESLQESTMAYQAWKELGYFVLQKYQIVPYILKHRIDYEDAEYCALIWKQHVIGMIDKLLSSSSSVKEPSKPLEKQEKQLKKQETIASVQEYTLYFDRILAYYHIGICYFLGTINDYQEHGMFQSTKEAQRALEHAQELYSQLIRILQHSSLKDCYEHELLGGDISFYLTHIYLRLTRYQDALIELQQSEQCFEKYEKNNNLQQISTNSSRISLQNSFSIDVLTRKKHCYGLQALIQVNMNELIAAEKSIYLMEQQIHGLNSSDELLQELQQIKTMLHRKKQEQYQEIPAISVDDPRLTKNQIKEKEKIDINTIIQTKENEDKEEKEIEDKEFLELTKNNLNDSNLMIAYSILIVFIAMLVYYIFMFTSE